jgi:hypothetical protein
MSNVEIYDPQDTLIEKIMAHFGWYKVKKVELPIENLEINHIFTMKASEEKLPEFPVKRPTVKKATTRRKANAK